MEPFWRSLLRFRRTDEDALFELAARVSVFKDLSLREFRRLKRVLHRQDLAAGEAVVREGETGEGIYIILSGEMRVVQRREDGSDQQLAVLGEGDFFGEQALLDDLPSSASAIAVESCQLVGFFRPDLLNLIESDPRLGLKILMRIAQMVSVRLRHTNRLLKEAHMWLRKQEMGKRQGAGEQAAQRQEEGQGGAVEGVEERAREEEESTT